MRIQNGYKRLAVNKGSTILKAKPFAYVLCSLYRNERCDYCFQSDKQKFRCAGCQYVYYCDRHCQKEAWLVHKHECPNLKRISPRVMPDMARLMARIILKLEHGGVDEVGYYTDTKYRKFKDLMSHYTNIRKDENRAKHIIALSEVLHEFFGEKPLPNAAELIGIYGRICVNSFNILDMDANSIGVGIYLGPSIMDHSCKPNAVVTFEGTAIAVRILQDIPHLDWSKIRISYIDELQTTKTRRKQLQSQYYFWCTCEKCEADEPMAEAIACVNEKCTYPCPLNVLTCPGCGTKIPEELKEAYDSASEFTTYQLDNMKNMAYLDVTRICLQKQKGVFHPLNVQHVQTLATAVSAAVNLESWEEAESYAEEVLPGYLHYYGEIHVLTGLMYLTLGKIQLYLNKPKLALDSLNKANKILIITHGERHPLMRDNLKPLLFEAAVSTQ